MNSIAAQPKHVLPARRISTGVTPRFTSASDSAMDACVIAMLALGVVLAVIS